MLKDSFEKLGRRLLEEVRQHYGQRLVSLVLFGSVARGTQTPDSDLDFLVVAESLRPGRMKRVEDFAAVEAALEPDLMRMKETGISTSLSPVFKTPEEILRGSPLFLDMVEDARLLYDRDGLFQEVLDRLRGRLAELGAQRKWSGNAWYWDLKPGCKAGEVFEL